MFQNIRLKKKNGISLIETMIVLVFIVIINGFLITMLSLTLKMWTFTQTNNAMKNQIINLTLYLKREIESNKNIDLLVREDSIEIKRSDKKIIFSMSKDNLIVKHIDEWGRKLNENILVKDIETINFIKKGKLLYMILIKDGVQKRWVFQRKKWVDF